MKSAANAVVLLSGGLDSATILAIAATEGHRITALSFRYGQRHARELDAAQNLATAAERHVVIDLDLRAYGGSALTDDIDVPKDRTTADMANDIPITYVPARNTIFLSHALALAEVEGAGDIFIGVNALDYSGYPDCRPDYIRAFETMANLATKAGIEGTMPVRLRTPLIDLSKAEIIRRGVELGVDYGATLSCYDPPATEILTHCGGCDACYLRKKGFADASIMDPTVYAP